ncbi:hypothetical protein NQL31_007078 [Lotmaria passim]
MCVAVASTTDTTLSSTGSGSTATASPPNTLHLHYYAPLPLRVVNEDYALIAGFLGGLLIFAVYIGVLMCLRCLRRAQTAQHAWQHPLTQRPQHSPRPPGLQSPAAQNNNLESASVQRHRTPAVGAATAAAAAGSANGSAWAQRLYDAPPNSADKPQLHYARGMRSSTASPPPTPPPR